MPPKNEPAPTPLSAFLVLHRDVQEQLDEWSQNRRYQVFAANFEALLAALRRGLAPDVIKHVHASVFRTRLKRAKGAKVDEYGDNQSGGAPRIFGIRVHPSWIFVGTGVEKRNHGGCLELPRACKRADELVKRLRTPTEAAFRALEPAYTVEPIPPPRC